MSDTIKLAGIVEESFTDGSGIRFSIFTQGCKHHCKNCHNPETWSFDSGTEVDIQKIYDSILENPMLDGVTFTGGDPMYQAKACTALAKMIKDNTSLNIWCYTGFRYEELMYHPDMYEFMQYIDVLVDGEYKEEQRCLAEKFRGSKNQRIIDVKKSIETLTVVTIDL